MKEFFRRTAGTMAQVTGSPWAFLAGVLTVLIWAATGPLFGFSDTWQLVINTGTTIVTFLLVFLIQNTQNRDAKAIHLKLDELLRGVEGARTGLVDLQSLTDDQLEELQAQFHRLHHREGVDVSEDLVGRAATHKTGGTRNEAPKTGSGRRGAETVCHSTTPPARRSDG